MVMGYYFNFTISSDDAFEVFLGVGMVQPLMSFFTVCVKKSPGKIGVVYGVEHRERPFISEEIEMRTQYR